MSFTGTWRISIFEQPPAPLARQHKQPQDGVAVNVGEPLDTANRYALNKQPENEHGFFHWQVHLCEMAVMRLSEGLAALRAAIALMAPPVLPKFLGLTLTFAARHFDPCFSSSV